MKDFSSNDIYYVQCLFNSKRPMLNYWTRMYARCWCESYTCIGKSKQAFKISIYMTNTDNIDVENFLIAFAVFCNCNLTGWDLVLFYSPRIIALNMTDVEKINIEAEQQYALIIYLYTMFGRNGIRFLFIMLQKYNFQSKRLTTHYVS